LKAPAAGPVSAEAEVAVAAEVAVSLAVAEAAVASVAAVAAAEWPAVGAVGVAVVAEAVGALTCGSSTTSCCSGA
jgi:hypothetical protein